MKSTYVSTELKYAQELLEAMEMRRPAYIQ